jgi:hypothetical protein
MNRHLPVTAVAVLVTLTCAPASTGQPTSVRPPATPLVVHDPYFSVWSMSDRLTEEPTKHWTGTEQPLTVLVRIDGKPYRCAGGQPRYAPATPPMNQVRRQVTPTRTVYGFEEAGIRLDMTFLTPALPDDLEVLSRPVTYLTWEARSTDGREHDVSIYFDAGAQLAVNTPEQRVVWSRVKIPGLDVIRMGTAEQPVLAKSGDNLRIDWGYLYVAAPDGAGFELAAVNQLARGRFITLGALPETDDLEPPAQTSRNQAVLAAAITLRSVGAASVSRHLMLAYDDLFSIQYFHRNLRPYWARNGSTAGDLLQAAHRDYDSLLHRSRQFDLEITRDLTSAGGAKYAQLAVLAYRQTLAAHKLVADLDGTLLYFSKENFSNGCIATVDVTYPSAPFFLLFNPDLLAAQLTPIFQYASLPRWPWPYAPHDIGTYPLANGQVYGGGEKTEERQMPVEESGNMLILTAALAKVQGNANYAAKYWPLLSKWAEYLKEKGLDPENQLSTDDFAGHLAHNTNLSVKAILALRSYAMLAEQLGKQTEAASYTAVASQMAAKWHVMAADGDHYRLAFDRPGTWSQKYNLVWDTLLDFRMFEPEIARTEIAFYKTKQNPYGLPLDNREAYTKLDWIVWTATLADDREDFEALVDPVYKFVNESTSRVPLTDWYGTLDGKQRGFQARSVVGGVFIAVLKDATMWRKWSERSRSRDSR